MNKRICQNSEKLICEMEISSSESSYQKLDIPSHIFPLRDTNSVEPDEYVQMMRDVLRMNKNLCLCRNFYKLDPEHKK